MEPAQDGSMNEAAMDGRELLGALRAVIPHASDDEDIPAIRRVVIQISGGQLHVWATNRYTVAMASADLDDPDGTIWRTELLPDDAKEIVRLFKPAKDADLTLRLTQSGSRLTAADVTGLFPGREYTVPDISGSSDVPDIPRLIAETLDREAGPLGRPIFSAGLLALFDAAGREYRSPLVWTPTGDHQPVIVQCGTQFLGLLMPVRSSDEQNDEHDETLAAWRSRLPVLTETEEAA